MKKYLIFLITLFFSLQNVLAGEVTTYKRTDENLLVPPNIEVTSKNRASILSTPAIDVSEKVYDFADLLTDIEEEALYEKINSAIEHTNYDLAIVTTNDNNKYNAMAYADDFFDYNYFGVNASRDGLLILIDMDTREVYISTSGYAIKMYDDNRIDRIIDAGYNYLKNHDYYDCLVRMIDSIDNYYNSGFPASNNNLLIDDNGNPYIIKRMPYLPIVFIASIISLIISLILYYKTLSKLKKQTTVTYINSEFTNINKKDQFLTTHTSRIKIDHSSSSSGGGSSFHSGSSGRSHGGGGRHF